MRFIPLPNSIFQMIPFSRNAILLAPMVGITNRAFRTLVHEIGAPDYYFTEMASAEAFVSHAIFEKDYTDARPEPHKTSVQFYARSPETIAKACAELLSREGAPMPQGIDINFGCSAPHIRKAGGGSAWSANPESSAELVAAARAAWPHVLSAKIRIGPDDDYDRFHFYCQKISEAGLDFLTLHPRTDAQKFRRMPRYDLIGRLSRDLSIPVIGNGDITGFDSLVSLIERQKPYAVMIGREAVRRPWIFRLLGMKMSGSAPGFAVDRLSIGLRFIELVEAMVPEPWRIETSRRFFSYYCDTFSFAHHIKFKLINSPDLKEAKKNLTMYFDQVPGDRMLFVQ